MLGYYYIGMRIKLVLLITELLEKYLYTPKLLASLQNVLKLNSKNKKSLVIFDVGANRGQSISFFTKNFFYKSIFAFEPDPKVFSQLKSFSARRGVFINNFALGERDGKIPFYTSPLTVTSSLILPNQDSSWERTKRRILGLSKENSFEEIEVEIRTLDSFVKSNSIIEIDILKIDVEGSELQVLNGATESLTSKKINIIQIEVHYDDQRKSTFTEIDTLLRTYNYVQFDEIRHSFGNFSDLIYI
jgi:FkbM family methyltransferase